MTEKQIGVMTKVLYAVETGGQVYGNADYGNFTEAYTNTSNEHAITIGAGQWLGVEAKKLLALIRKTDPEMFTSLDTAGIGKDLDEAQWSTYKVAKGTAKAKCIQKLIASDAGKKCQDALMAEQIRAYEQEAVELGVMDVKAVCMCINIRHLGGLSAVKRILKKAVTPYTMKGIWNAMQGETGNQVGAPLFRSRHLKVMEWLDTYMEGSEAAMRTREAVVEQAKAWLGRKESDGSHQEIIDLYNSHTPRVRGYKMQYTDAWCACFVSAVAMKLGYEAIFPIEINCWYMMEKAKEMGIWVEQDSFVPSPGDLILYDWQDSGKGDNEGVPDHVGIVEKVGTAKITVIEGNYQDSVKRRTVNINGKNIRGFVCPKYDAASSGEEMKPAKNDEAETKPSEKANTSTESKLNETPKWVGAVTAALLNVRTWAGMEYPNITKWPVLAKGNLVDICDEVYSAAGEKWYFVRIDGRIFGFVHSDYIKKA